MPLGNLDELHWIGPPIIEKENHEKAARTSHPGPAGGAPAGAPRRRGAPQRATPLGVDLSREEFKLLVAKIEQEIIEAQARYEGPDLAKDGVVDYLGIPLRDVDAYAYTPMRNKMPRGAS